MTSRLCRLYGTEEVVTPWRRLRAGVLSMDWRGVWLRRITWGFEVIWDGLGLVLRDPHWGTPGAGRLHTELRQDDCEFELTVRGEFEPSCADVNGAPGLPFVMQLAGDRNGRIRVQAEVYPTRELAVNRLGLCLLHPASCAGARVEVLHGDGRRSATTFPEQIPPWPPFTLVRGLRHEWAPGRWASALLEGALFETEDQRNNADASFKTYSRSNMAPRPYRLSPGVPWQQSAEMVVDGARDAWPIARPLAGEPSARVVVGIGTACGSWPAIGIEIDATDAARPQLALALRVLRPRFLHLVWLPGQSIAWAGVALLLQAAGAGLRLDVVLTENADVPGVLGELAASLAEVGLQPAALAVFPSRQAEVQAARAAFPGTRVGGGSRHFFVQLSRLDDLGGVDFACFTTSSIVHGADDEDVMAGLRSLPAMVASWQARHPSVPLQVGPSDIAARTSPLGDQPRSDGLHRVPLAAVDPRSRAQFGAAWVVGHMAALAQPGVDSISVLALSHPGRGVVTIQPNCGFTPRPAFHALSALAELARTASGSMRLGVQVSQPGRLAALAGRFGHSQGILLANLGFEPLRIELQGLAGRVSRVQHLDAEADEGLDDGGWRTLQAVVSGCAGALEMRLPSLGLVMVEVHVGAAVGQP